MFSSPRSYRFHAVLLALVASGIVSLAGRQVNANLLPSTRSRQLRSRVSPDLQKLVTRLGPGQAFPVDNTQGGLAPDRMLFDSQGRVGIHVTATDPEALLPSLRALGVSVTAYDQSHHVVEGFAPTNALAGLAGLDGQGLMGVRPIPKPIRWSGSVLSQADFVAETDRVRATVPGLNGTGQRIGVISDSYNVLGTAPLGVTSGDLPATVTVLREGDPTDSDEGRGMIELVHDLAPGAGIAFGTANGGEAAFAQMIRDLADPSKGNCNVVVDDIVYFAEPFFQDGLVAQAADDVVNNRRAAYFSAAGNGADQSYESANFRPRPDPAGFLAHDFDPSPAVTDTRQNITIPPFGSAIVTLQWDDPFYTSGGVDTDLDVRFYAAGTNTLAGQINTDNLALQEPVEVFSIQNPTTTTLALDLAVELVSGPPPGRFKYIYYGALAVREHATNSSTIFGHANAAGAMAVGAVDYDNQGNPSSFTSAGPSVILFDPNGGPLGAPNVRNKPDISAIQGTDTTFFGQDSDGNGRPNFFGTSAAAPHAAAIAALVRQHNPAFLPADVYNQLISTADSSINGAGFDVLTGNGLINAYDAILGPAAAATLPFTDGMESGVLSGAWETHSSLAGRLEVTNVAGPDAGTRHLVFHNSRNGKVSRNEAILHVDGTSASGAVLTFRQKEFSDSDQPMSADTRIKFQHFGAGRVPSGGMAIDDLVIDNLSNVRFGSAVFTVSENVGSATITVARGGDISGPLQVDYTTSDGTATLPADYTPASGTLTFAPDQASQTFTIPINPDRLIEGDETVNLTLSGAQGGILVSPSTATLLISDDLNVNAPSNLTVSAASGTSIRLNWTDNATNEDRFEVERKVGAGQFTSLTSLLASATTYVDAGLNASVLYTYRVRAIKGSVNTSFSNTASLTISPIQLEAATFASSEAAGSVVVRITRTGDILNTASVGLVTNAGTASSPDDYAAQSLTVNFIPGETAKEIPISIVQDLLLEPAETFDVRLQNPGGVGATLGAQTQATVTITDDRSRPAPSNLTAVATGAAEIQVAWTDNCANEVSQVLERRVNQGGFVILATLQPNEQLYTDLAVSAGVTYTYRVKAVQGDTESSYSNTASVSISTLQLAANSYSVLEEDGVVIVTVNRTGDPSLAATVSYSTSPGAAGTATPGADYTITSGTLFFAAGESTKTVSIPVLQDNLLEASETFTFSISNPTGAGMVVATPASAIISIADTPGQLTPTNLTATALAGGVIQLRWVDNTGNETSFEIERKTVGGAFAPLNSVGADVTSYEDSGLAANTGFTYRVRAVRAEGMSAYSNEASATTISNAPLAPAQLTAVARDGGRVQLNWADSSNDETSFLVERRTGSGEFTVIASLGQNVTQLLDTGLSAGQEYGYRVRAANAGGESDYSNTATVVFPAIPSAPSDLSAGAISLDAI
ncbi:MAG: bpr, partial [Armatimonadetes bacterium]|nr:bpr [Armatimonadota bacterium]